MSAIQGLEALKIKLSKLKDRYKGKAVVRVGYSSSYAIYVHENVEMKWKGLPRASEIGVYWGPHGQAKFLEQPFREMKAELVQIITKALKNGATLEEALTIAGLKLQRTSQELVPVEYGNLKASAFTRTVK